MALSGRNIEDLPTGFTPGLMLLIFFVGGLTIFNIPLIFVGMGEEFGWRGFLFPQLCRSRLAGGFIVGGLIWFAWHLPLVMIMPTKVDFTLGQHLLNGLVLAVGTILSFIYFAYVYAKSGTIWVAALAHTVFNNGSRSFSYFATVEDQLLANLGLVVTMFLVLALLFLRQELAVFEKFLAEERD
jgi:membrane protease YdiL (CAAX protease family)